MLAGASVPLYALAFTVKVHYREHCRIHETARDDLLTLDNALTCRDRVLLTIVLKDVLRRKISFCRFVQSTIRRTSDITLVVHARMRAGTEFTSRS
jgi:hypothetical protein